MRLAKPSVPYLSKTSRVRGLTKRFRQHLLSFKGWLFILPVILFCGCQQDLSTSEAEIKIDQSPNKIEVSREQANAQDKIWSLGEQLLNEAAVNSETLNAQITQLVDEPSSESMRQAQDSWAKTKESIELFYVFTRFGLVEPENFKPLLDLQLNTATWPIQPGYLDSYGNHLYSGIIFDISSPIDEQTLRGQHGLTDAFDATLGIYAIGFLLFGENNQRSYIMFKPLSVLTDNQLEKGYQKTEELPRNRRRSLLKLQAELLAQDITKARTLWSSKQPDSMPLAFRQRSKESREILLTQAAQNMLTEQILAIAELQKPDNTEDKTLRGQQLSDRIASQLLGLSLVTKATNIAGLKALSVPSRECGSTIKKIHSTGPQDVMSQETSRSWKEGYECTRQLIRNLSETD